MLYDEMISKVQGKLYGLIKFMNTIELFLTYIHSTAM